MTATDRARRALTPGSLKSGVTRAQVVVPGYATSVRPGRARSWLLKLRVMRRYRYPLTAIRNYTLDHLVPLECGGHPTSMSNLWPQPKAEALDKDRDEDWYHHLLLLGTIDLDGCLAFFRGEWTR